MRKAILSASMGVAPVAVRHLGRKMRGMRAFPALELSALLAASLLTAACGDKTKQSTGVSQPQQEYLLPQTLFAYGDVVYALDSNADTLEVVHPTTSVEELPFDVSPRSAYRRDAETEWIAVSSGAVLERKIGTKDWTRFEVDSGIRNSIVSEGNLYIEHRTPEHSRENRATISLFRNGRIEKSWTTAYTGMSRSAPPTFVDEHRNLALIIGGEKTVILKSEDLPFDPTHNFNDVFAVGWVRGSAFAVQDSLYMIRKQVASKVGIKIVNWWSVDAERDDAWVVGKRANRTIAAHYTGDSWSEADLGELVSGMHSIFSAGKRACIFTWHREGKFQVTALVAKGEMIAHVTSTMDRNLFATEQSVVFADGSWWISPREPGELVRIDAAS